MDVYIRQAVENGKVIFPKKFVMEDSEKGDRKVESIEQLKRDLIPSEFAALYLNDPVDSDAIEFKPAWFQKYDPNQHNLEKATCVMSIDPAFRLKQTNDFTGICISKIDANNNVYILEALKLKLNANELIHKIFELVEIYRPGKVLLETVAAQIVLLELMRSHMQKTGKWFVIEEVKLDTRETKAVRLRAMIPFYANMKIFHRTGLTDLEAQLVEFPRGLHEDIIDALSQQVPYWKAPHLAVPKEEVKPYTFKWWKMQARRPQNNTEKLFQDFRGR